MILQTEQVYTQALEPEAEESTFLADVLAGLTTYPKNYIQNIFMMVEVISFSRRSWIAPNIM